MDFEFLLSAILDFYRQNQVVALLGVAAVVGYAVWRPKSALRMLLFLAFAAGAFYVATFFTDSLDGGIKQKDQMIHKSDRMLKD